MIQIRYFGVLQTELNTASEQLAWQDGASTDELLTLLRSRGVELTVLDDAQCIELMARLMREQPALWNEDIGEDDCGGHP